MNIFQRLSQLISGGEPKVEAPAAPLPTERKNAPVVGVSGSKATSKSVIAMMTQLRSAGAEPVFIGDHASRVAGGVDAAVARDLARIDALVVLGNDADIDPAKYGQKPHPATKVEAPERAAYEEAAIQRALDMGMPLTCVCMGMQRLNVIGGGTLNQSLPETLGDNHHQQQGERAPFVPVQFVEIAPDSKLNGIEQSAGLYTPRHSPLPPNVIMENSMHHQAVEQVRSDFRASAVSDDGVIEAIEPKAGSRYDGQFVVGVQWHPEFGASDFGAKLASKFTQAASEFSQGKEMSAPASMMGALPIEGELARRFLAERQQQALHR